MKLITKNKLSEKWLQAAVVGSLWATVEIVLGSLLHNLRLPMAGSTLSFITVYLIIAFFQLWKTNGLIWRAGLICALMKSISPSAIILGPMIGILSQAIILDLIIRIFGKNLLAYTFGGALAVFSALAQKVITLLVLYGHDFVVLLENLYSYAARQIKLEGVAPIFLLFALSLIYLISGAIAALSGYFAGKRYLQTESPKENTLKLKPHAQSDLFKHTLKNDHSIAILAISLMLLIAGMFLVSKGNIFISGIFVMLVLFLGFWKYPKNMGYFKKAALWLQLGLIVILSALLKSGGDSFFSIEGAIIGLKMGLRAILLLSCFAIISVEIKNPIIKKLLYDRGFKNLYQSAELAFSALPGIMEQFYNQSSSLKAYKSMTQTMLQKSKSLLEAFRNMEKDRKPIFIISGKINEGKTTLTKTIVESLKEQGFKLKGFLCLGNTNDNNRNQYKVQDLNSLRTEVLCTTFQTRGKLNYGRFFFENQGIEFGRQILLNKTPSDMVVIDEIGPMELNDQGWTPAIEQLLEKNEASQLWVVRENLIKPISNKWTLGDTYIFKLNEDKPKDIIQTIAERLKKEKEKSITEKEALILA